MRTKVLRFRHFDREFASTTNAGGVSYRSEGTARGKRATIQVVNRQYAIVRRNQTSLLAVQGTLDHARQLPAQSVAAARIKHASLVLGLLLSGGKRACSCLCGVGRCRGQMLLPIGCGVCRWSHDAGAVGSGGK